MQQPLTREEVQQLRAETKGTAGLIHLNNAGASLPPDVVVQTVVDYLQYEAIHGGYEAEYTYNARLNAVYTSIAKLINASTDEIALTENASAGWWLAFNGLALKPGDEILTCEMEYVTNILGFLHARKALGVTVKVIPNDANGNFMLDALEDAITANTKLIAATHIGSTTGDVMPVAEIGKIAKRHNITYLLDACQSIGHMPVDVHEIGCDMLAVTGRKYLRAPRGTGFLYVTRDLIDKLNITCMDGLSAPDVTNSGYSFRKDARRFELYEKNRALTLGLGCAADYALHIGVHRVWQRVQYLAAQLRNKLRQVAGITVLDLGDVQSGIVTFLVKDVQPCDVKRLLAAKNINVSVGKAHSTLYYMEKYGIENNVRASIHYYNTEEEIDTFCRVVAEISSGH